jgi:uncharacterized membrane protein YjjP (DUF1212 family)
MYLRKNMSDLTLNKVAELAIETGRIVLENGGETHRAEETMHNVCTGFGFAQNESYVTLTGMFLTLKSDSGEIVTVIKRIENRNVDLDRISAISKLTHDLKKRNCTNKGNPDFNPMSFEEFNKRLDNIKAKKRYPNWVNFLCGGTTPGFFCLLFGGGWLEFGVAFVMGVIVTIILKLLTKLRLNTFLLNAVGAALIVWLAKMSGVFIGYMNLDKVIIGGIMLLVPGLSITNAIRDTMAGDLVAGTARTVEALYISAAIATGAGSMLKLWSLLG